ncbi:TIM barrel protein [Alcaligenaceae bacterium]|nr:TIM barrel protein [Alcaligenaceae bacterium]
MTSPQQVFVSLGSFGATEVKRHGQEWFVRLCHEAGADGVEIRGELLTGHDGELDALARTVRDLGLACVYSSPDMLWDSQGKLAEQHLDNGLAAARALGSKTLKMSIGGFGGAADHAWPCLDQRLAEQDITLLIENDQTPTAGAVNVLQAFFKQADHAGLNLGMTFDMGNWHWNGECPMQAAQAFSGRVSYIHCKGVQRQLTRWIAVPLQDSAAPWRALLRAMPCGVPRAIEYPLVGEDLASITRSAIQQLRTLETTR